MKDEIKIITLGDIFKNLETEEKAFKLKDYITNLQEENEKLNNIIKHTDSWVDRTIEIIKQQPSEDDTWILDRLDGLKFILKGDTD